MERGQSLFHAQGRRNRDLAQLAELLDGAAANPAPRARLESVDPAVVALARAVDRHLDADLERDLERRRADERFREQLAALSHDIRTPLAGAHSPTRTSGSQPRATKAPYRAASASVTIAARSHVSSSGSQDGSAARAYEKRSSTSTRMAARRFSAPSR